ncbi:type I restriction-modification system, restriction subunit R [[Mycoplasma] phocae]|uniref:Type I restriction enzyme endonuclease subunit n=1 Tax=[Mycoplasma] phocae TaxID=142651 RepID=A0A2Z5IR45_9BACT|nr:HsdR family type I site-specific deoxyribonuclease [[Mycoplasma] phocae]AXE60871.1 type I restriction-modification system, restriction subunit R [[Mycoplasma] phocae]
MNNRKFKDESEFEEYIINALIKHGWSSEVLNYPNEAELIKNWRNIINQSNVDIIKDEKLTDNEMNQIMDKVISINSPYFANKLINDESIQLRRDSGETVYLKIFKRSDAAVGSSVYQIARQVYLHDNKKRADIVLLINGLPVIFIELKNHYHNVMEAVNQIQDYSVRNKLNGIFNLIQFFVAMTPEETLYFINPGKEPNAFNQRFYFHWANFDNVPVNDYDEIIKNFLSIPTAHQFIAFYIVAESNVMGGGDAKIMRSYQYFAADKIVQVVSKHEWAVFENNEKGGFISHTTGSGKTMTSFKAAELISHNLNVDKVIFVVDRVVLASQSYKSYNNFSQDNEGVEKVDNYNELKQKILDSSKNSRLIISSIHKLSKMAKEMSDEEYEKKFKKLNIVFIVDEAHRSTFGDMMIEIKSKFKKGLFFGFTGTPIYEANNRGGIKTSDIFGNELHKYTIADGIRDKNVLGFDIYGVHTFDEKNEIMKRTGYEEWSEKYNNYYSKILNFDPIDIENLLENEHYENSEHRNAVVDNIAKNFEKYSRNRKFHAILATSSKYEAIEYYKIFKEKYAHKYNVTAVFDKSFNDSKGNKDYEQENMFKKILSDYSKMFKTTEYDLDNYHLFKSDLSQRLAHKFPYEYIENKKDEQIDILIVVNQMLTGYDSKWLNTLYLDKILEGPLLIQAFSRTNRLFDKDKPFGIVKWYRKVATMHKNVDDAVKLYSSKNNQLKLFVDKLPENIKKINDIYKKIEDLYSSENINITEPLQDQVNITKFTKLYNDLMKTITAAKIQGLDFDKDSYYFALDDENNFEIISQEQALEFGEERIEEVNLLPNKNSLQIFQNQYRDIVEQVKQDIDNDCIPMEIHINPDLVDEDLGKIDYKYINYLFQNKKFDDLEKTIASMSREDQKYAKEIINEVKNSDYTDLILTQEIERRKNQTKENYINKLIENFPSLNFDKLEIILNKPISGSYDINKDGVLDEIINIPKEEIKTYFDNNSIKYQDFKIKTMFKEFIKKFVLKHTFDIDNYNWEIKDIQEIN